MSMEQLAQLPVFDLIAQFSYGAVFLLSILANVFIPLPEEITLLFLGYLTGVGQLNFILTFMVVVLGLFISDSAIYYLAYRGNRFVQGVYDRIFAARLGNDPEFINRHIGKIIFISRFLVQLRFIGPYLAGHRKVPYKDFIQYDLGALTVYVLIFLGLGNVLHKKVERIISGVGTIQKFIILIVVIWIGYTLFKLFLKSSFWSTIKQSFE